ncbi:N-succinylarginine dihydrolase [Motilimonas pumila]|uniref:N-succinylarginine dihydrolase n=1 Tax=Motilimonas pumila TaxID=2303987 RepID=A0A418YCJ4_9GAMM|nr:N-succinylarginine dihydrolase [Motilimonas pumila]RJG42212.1 N-succinylarginine dihydrolase [Motilimonas pumila]
MSKNHRHYVNFDGLIGPSHNFAGLASGNLASALSARHNSSPKQAALQGLKKMRMLQSLGLVQGIIPPLPRPDLNFLSRLGCHGSAAQKIAQASELTGLVEPAYSASNMWVANAASISSSRHSINNKVQITPANLVSQLHRSLETRLTQRLLKCIFHDAAYFTHHLPLPQQMQFADEGAANIMSLETADKQLTIFVYGRAHDDTEKYSHGFTPRQSLLASQAVARLHGLPAADTGFVKQHNDAIQAGVFHNDVIAVSQGNTLFYHQTAFTDSEALLALITQHFGTQKIELIAVKSAEISLQQAVKSYLFNSQLVPLKGQQKALVCPLQCQQIPEVARYLSALTLADNSISKVVYVDLLQSMKNGGGPACLRLSLQLTQQEIDSVADSFWLTEQKYRRLVDLVNAYYPAKITPENLISPALLVQLEQAFGAIADEFELQRFYQQGGKD